MARSRSVKFEPTAQMRVILLHGREPFLMRERTRQLVEVLESAHGEIEQFAFNGADVDLATLLDELRSYGLLQTHKLVIVDQADKFLTGQDQRRRAMERYVQSPVDHATLLLRAETWRPGKLDKAIAAVGGVFKIEGVDSATAARWCIDRCERRHGATIDRQAATGLVTLIGPDLDRLDAELGKLASFVGEGGTIRSAEIMELVGLSREQQAWVIQSALVAGDPAAALRTLRELVHVSRQPEQLIIWAVTDLLRKVHTASRLREQGVHRDEIARRLKLWGAGRDQVLAAAGAARPHRLAQLLRHGIETDYRIKRGFGESGRSLEALTVLVTDSMGAPARGVDR